MKPKTTPKVPMSFRLSPKLKTTIKERAALDNMKTSDYLSQLIEKNFSTENNTETSRLSKFILEKKKKINSF